MQQKHTRLMAWKVLAMTLVVLLFAAACTAPPVQAPAEEAAATEPAEEETAVEETAEEEAGEAATHEEPADEAAAEDIPVIGMMKIVSHPALDAEQQGVKDALAEAGYIEGESIRILESNAEGDIPTLTTIAQRFVDEGVDLIVATSTPALQAAYNVTQDQENPPIVFNAVTSPYAAGIAESPTEHPSWVIGIQALGPIAEAVGLIPQMMPDVQTVGYIYNPAEANSVVNTEIAEPAAEELGLDFQISTISNSGEVQTAAEALVARGAEAFFISTDSTVVAGLEALIRVANDNDVPFFANDPDSAERGAAVALGLDYYQDGLDTGALVVGILNGELDIASTPIESQDAGSLVINLSAAEEQGLEIPQEFIDQADQIFE